MFENREEAARLLAGEIEKRIKETDFIVGAILRGGIVLGRIISDYFKVSLEPLVVRKIGAPFSSELAIGAVGSGKIVYWDENLIKKLKIQANYKSSVLKEKFREVKNLEEKFSIQKNSLEFENKRVIIVDDGVATGATVLCARKVLKTQRARRIVLAVPVISNESFDSIKGYFDKVIVLKKARDFSAVGQFYRDFPQVEDEEVVRILNQNSKHEIRNPKQSQIT